MISRQQLAWGDAHVNSFFSAMAFITYILLAGMALGIQKRSALLPLLFSWLTVCVSDKYLCVLCVKVQSRGPWIVCEHCPRVDHHRGVGDAVVFVPADSSQRPLHLWPHCLQWIQICWVNVSFCDLWLRLKSILIQFYIKIVDTSLSGWSSPCYVACCLAVMVILWD